MVRAVEQRITRREALGAAGAVGAALLVGRNGLPALEQVVSAAPAAAATKASTVAVTPSMTEGPYWVDEMLRRFDVRADTGSSTTVQAGVPLTVKINVLDASGGGAINNAHVDIWHANAYGLYSDESGQQTGGGTTNGNTTGQNFLRGYQVTGVDAGAGTAPVNGQVTFKTIWPGWYNGRAIHIHVRVRTYNGSAVATNYTTQIFFTDADNATVLNGAAPYNTRSPKTDPTTDESDNVLSSSADATNIVPVTGSIADGFAATFTIGLTGVASNASAASSTDTKVSASLASAKVTRSAKGVRILVLSVHTGEKLTAHASLVREGKTLGSGTGQLSGGAHTLRVTIPAAVTSGAATAKLTLSDAAGNTKSLSKQVTVPA
jgi:protocatechuate 3,4-dioxygenase beta subunit